MPPSYARGAGFRAASGGINNIIQMLMANRADDEKRELMALREQEARRMGGATELMQPDVVPLAQGVSDYDIDPAALQAIGNAAEPVAPVTFTQPPPRTVDVPGGTPLTVQDSGPSVTPFGNVQVPEISRMLNAAGEQEKFNLGQGRAADERDRVAGVLGGLGFTPQETAVMSEGFSLPRDTSAPQAMSDATALNVLKGQDTLFNDETGAWKIPVDQLAERIAALKAGIPYEEPVAGQSTPDPYSAEYFSQRAQQYGKPGYQEPGGPSHPVRASRVWGSDNAPSMGPGAVPTATNIAPAQTPREVEQWQYDRAVQDLGEDKARMYFVVRRR